MKQFLFGTRLCLLVLSAWLVAGCGGGSDSDTTPPPVVNTQPNSFSFTAQSNVDPDITITSNSITVSGINAATNISIQNGEYSVNDGDFTSASATVTNSTQIRVRHQTSTQYSTSRTTTLTIGGISADFVSTTRQRPASGSDTPPQASIIFPWSQSKTTAGTLRVRGTATSSNGISALSVNGVAANVHRTSASAARVSAQNSNLLSDDEDEDEEETFDWEAEIEIEDYSDTTLVVAVSDLSGNQDDEADSAHTSTLQAPIYLAYDSMRKRLIGIMDNRDVVAIDPVDSSYQVLAAVELLTTFNLDQEQNRILYPHYADNIISLFSLDLETGIRNSLLAFTPELATGVQVIAVKSEFDPVNQLVFILLRLLEADSIYATDHLYQFDLSDDTGRLLSSSSLNDNPILAIREMTILGTQLYAIAGHNHLIEVNTQTGQRTIVLEHLINSPMTITAGAESDQLFVAGFKGILKVFLSAPGAAMLSEETSTSEFPTSQITDAVLLNDETLLVVDSSFQQVIQVDTATGERSAFISSGIGTGRSLLSPQYLTFADNYDTLYVFDYAQNAAESLFAIDLKSGNRAQLIEINRPFSTHPSGLYFHNENDALLVGFNDAIWSVSLTDNSKTVISDAETGSGADIGTLAGGDFDASTATLFKAQFALENAVLLIDVATGERSLLEFDGSAGVAGIIDGVNDIALDTANQQLYLASQSQSAIYRLDMQTLETELVVDQCINFVGQNILDVNVDGIQKITFLPEKQQLQIITSRLAIYDFASQTCTIRGQSYSFLNALLLEDGTYLTTSQAALEHFDPKTLRTVIISK